MTKERAERLLKSIDEIKVIKAMLMHWQNADGYSLEPMVESYLRGISESAEAGTRK